MVSTKFRIFINRMERSQFAANVLLIKENYSRLSFNCFTKMFKYMACPRSIKENLTLTRHIKTVQRILRVLLAIRHLTNATI